MEPQEDIFWISVVILTIFSGLGSLAIMMAILLRLRKDYSTRLVFHLSLADFCLSFVCLSICAYNLNRGHVQEPGSFMCAFQPVITWYFMEVSILWLTMVAIHSYRVTFFGKPFPVKFEILTTMLCWMVPLITTIIPLVNGSKETYGPRNGLWCSFSRDDKLPQLINILVYYIPALSIISICYLIIIWKIRHFGEAELTGSIMRKKIKAMRKMSLYVISYLIVWSPLMLCYIYEFKRDKFIPFWAEYISDNLLHIQGLLNLILYGINEDLIRNTSALICPLTKESTEPEISMNQYLKNTSLFQP